MSWKKPVILLTGKPKVGKTTIIIKLIQNLGDLAGGFYTREIIQKSRRTGFQIVTLQGASSQLATCNRAVISGRVVPYGKYWVSLDAIESLAIPAINDAVHNKQIVIIDEIGPMELLSPLFAKCISEFLESDCLGLGTIVKRDHPFANTVKAHDRVKIREVTAANRDSLSMEIYRFFMESNV